jgi:large subunit ribosomal protein L10
MDRTQKAAVIDQVAANIQDAEAIFAVDYRGISVTQAAALRSRLRDADASFRIVKNTLTERAADAAGAEALKAYLEGPTAMTFVRGDVALAAKALSDFRRTEGLLAFKGGVMGGEPLDVAQIDALARLPSREVLYGRLVGMVASPLTGLAAAMDNLISGLARQLAQMAEQGLVGGDAPAQAPAEEAADAAEAPAAETEQPPPAEDSPADTEADQDAEPKEVPDPGPDPDPEPGQSEATP